MPATLPVLLLLPFASAADHHACDCGPAAAPSCQPGDDAASGDTPTSPWRTLTAARQAFGATLGPGDRVLLCRGGAFTADGGAWVNGRCTAAAPCTVGAYTPASGDTADPVIESSGFTAFDLGNPGDARAERGYVFEHLDLRCEGCETTGGVGVLLFNDVDHVTLRDLSIGGFGVGVHVAGTNPCLSEDADCDGQSSDLTIERARVHGSSVIGFLGGADRTRILDSTFSENGTDSAFHHNLYLAGATGPTRDVEIRGNTLHRSSWQGDARCQGASLAVHGSHSDLVITDNLVMEDPGGADPGCWGIAVDAAHSEDERIHRLTLARNTVIDMGEVGIGLSSCVDCVVENNVVASAQAFPTTGIQAPDRPLEAGDAEMSGLTVRNNSLWLAAGGAGISLPDQVSGHVVVSNAIALGGAGPCFEGAPDPTGYAAFSHNVCGATDGAWFSGVGDLGDWQATGLGAASQATDPGFSEPSAGAWGSASGEGPMVDAGHPDRSAALDRDGARRGDVPDAGAAEWTGGDDTGPGGDGGGAGDGGGGEGSGGGPGTPREPGTSAAAAAGERGGCSCGAGASPGGLAGLGLLGFLIARRRSA